MTLDGRESASSSATMDSNNPFRQRTVGHDTAQQSAHIRQAQSNDSDKQVASSEGLSGADNAPSPIEDLPSGSRHENAPISMAHHESYESSQHGHGFVDDVKGPPPAYDSISSAGAHHSGSVSPPLSSPQMLEPDSQGDIPTPRPEDRSAVAHLLSWIKPAPQAPSLGWPRLAQPVVIPQLGVPPTGESVPFQRCYSDALACRGVSMAEFTRFLDGLELAQSPSSTLQGLRMFGAGVTHVPIPVLGLLAGRGISALASSGSGHSGSRAKLYLQEARERFFEPRGLRLHIVKDNDLNARVQVPTHAPRLALLTQSTLPSTSCQRRVEAIAPYVAPLRYDVPDPDKQMQGVQKLARKHLNARFKEKGRRIEALRTIEWAGHAVIAGSWEERYASKLADVRRAQLDLIHENQPPPGTDQKGSAYAQKSEALRIQQHELQLIVSERQNQGKNAPAVQAEMEEITWVRRLKWLVIEDMVSSVGRMGTAAELGLTG